MTGLEKIINQIIEEAEVAAAGKREQGEREAETILREAREQAEKEAQRVEDKTANDAAAYRARVESSCDMQRRTVLLKARQEIIRDTIGEAYRSLSEADTEQYFGALERLLENSVQPREGVMVLSAKDLERMPREFTEKVEKIAASHGGSLRIASEPGNLENGFILIYGGIEENCTLKAVFDAARDRMQDRVHEILWRDGHV